MFAYALTIFIGAFLLFQVQPLIGKYILPWFGGGPGVWTTCMLFFQMVLLGGYAYAHLCTQRLKPRAQACVQAGLLLAAVALLPIIPAESWKPGGGGNPTLQILALLTVSLGLPYFVLSSTGPLLQQWLTRTHPGRSPYRLFALSNFASLLALVSYPFYFETHFSRRVQSRFWGWGLVIYAAGCAWCALRLWKSQTQAAPRATDGPESAAREVTPESHKGGAPNSFGLDRLQTRTSGSWTKAAQSRVNSALRPSGVGALSQEAASARPGETSPRFSLLWLLLPACASLLLLATTNKLCLDVAVIPFLWVLPLALYLLSFVICFDNPRWYARLPFTVALVAALAGLCWTLAHGSDWTLWRQVGVYCAGLFVCCLVCHGELYRLRPVPEHLTSFYLSIAAGGALGGVLAAIAAPLLFTNYYELHWGLFLCGFLFATACSVTREPMRQSGKAAPPPAEPVTDSGADLASAATDDRPQPARYWRWLAYLLTLAAVGGLDRLIAPYGHHSPFRGYFIALRFGLWGLLVVMGAVWFARGKHNSFRYWRGLACCWLWLGVGALGWALCSQAQRSSAEIISTSRNFYGVLTVYEHRADEAEAHHFLLQHGRITHGLQFVDRERATWPTTYYGAESGVGLAFGVLPAGPRRIGLVGLGTGTLTAYSRPGDYMRIYEINPAVRTLATNRFRYLNQCGGKVEVALGDARLSMEREPPQQFDLLALDAFSSDAIPVHLLTREALELYQRHLKTNGVLAVHVSNHYLDLVPVVLQLARQSGYQAVQIDYDETDEDWWLYSSTWMLLSRDPEIIHAAAITNAATTPKTNALRGPLWTDDFASLFQILK